MDPSHRKVPSRLLPFASACCPYMGEESADAHPGSSPALLGRRLGTSEVASFVSEGMVFLNGRETDCELRLREGEFFLRSHIVVGVLCLFPQQLVAIPPRFLVESFVTSRRERTQAGSRCYLRDPVP